MDPEHQITLGRFRLETPQGRLWRGDRMIPLRPRFLAMLRYLAALSGRLVTKARCNSMCGRARMSPLACCYGRRGVCGGRRGDRDPGPCGGRRSGRCAASICFTPTHSETQLDFAWLRLI
jgi:hypothetical protein